MYKDINESHFQALLNKNTVMLDIREPKERQECYLENSEFLPLSVISLDKVLDIIEKKCDTSKDVNLVVYCRSGVRSINAINALFSDNEYKNMINYKLNIYNLQHGILGCSKNVVTK